MGANLITNGSFEGPSTPGGFVAGYTAHAGGYGTTPGSGGYYKVATVGTSLCTFFSTLAAQNGSYFYIADGNTNAMDVFSLNLSGLTTGQVYQFSYWYAKGSPTAPNTPVETRLNASVLGTVNISNSGGWTQVTYTFTAPSATPTLTLRNTISPGNTDGNDFYIDNLMLQSVTTCSVQTSINILINCPAPVELLDFDAVKQGAGALLTWQTVSETNSSHYIIEKSLDGNNFTSIGKVKAAGNSSALLSYSFVDPYITSGVTYYRLAQYDIDGTVHYTEIRTVTKNNGTGVQVVPNPNNGIFVVTNDNPGEQKSRISILNSLGQIVYENGSVDNVHQVDISQLASGIYYLQVHTADETVVNKIVKE